MEVIDINILKTEHRISGFEAAVTVINI